MNIPFRGWMRCAMLAAFALVSCSNDYNPFTDLSRARAVVTHKSFADLDTLNIFTTETLVVNVANRELVDSFSITAPSNRRSADTFTVRKHEPLESGPYTYLLSITDTGWKTVTVNTFRSNGDRVPQEFSLYLKSPLRQNPLSGVYGDTVALSTTPVRDTDVAYHWDFGNGLVVSSPKPTTFASVKMSSFSNVGSLWVSDLSGNNPSPRVPFAYYLSDTTGPLIQCASEGYSGKDTIITGDTTFYFKVKIWDPGQEAAVQSALVNGQKFDIVDDPMYVRVFPRMDTAARLFPVTVTAVNNPHFLVASQKTFWLGFSDSLSHGTGVLFTVQDPTADSTSSPTRDKGIFGYIEDYARDSVFLVVKMQLNDGTAVAADTEQVLRHEAMWKFTFTLADGQNRVRLSALRPERRFARGKIAEDHLRSCREGHRAARHPRCHRQRHVGAVRGRQFRHHRHRGAQDHRLRRGVGR